MPNLTELKFPSRAQRRQLMEQLKALQNDPQVAVSEEFRKYVENFTALDAKMNDIQEHNEEAEAFAKSQIEKMKEDQKDADELEKDFDKNFGENKNEINNNILNM